MNCNLLVIIGFTLLLAGTDAGAREVVNTFKWSQMLENGSGQDVVIQPATETRPFESATFINETVAEKTISLTVVNNPGISQPIYAIEGQVRYHAVEPMAYLQMWNNLPGKGSFFARTLAQQGPMTGFQGDSDWRPFILPFYIRNSDIRPDKISIDLVLPGRGEVSLSSFKLVQYDKNEQPLAAGSDADQWWGLTTAVWMGSMGGILLVTMGGLFNWLSKRGRGRLFVLTTIRILFALGFTALVFGAIACLKGQPYIVYYPLLLSGGIMVVVFGINMRPIRQRYEQLDTSKMVA